MARVIAVLDNGSGKRGHCCDDCGTSLRYEYHTSDGGVYGSECIHRHIHDGDWLTFKAAKDVQISAAIERQYQAVKALGKPLYYRLYEDRSATLDAGTFAPVSKYGEPGTKQAVDRLIEEGWTLNNDPHIPSHSGLPWRKYILSPPGGRQAQAQ